jgi:manganese transport protein
VIICLKLIIDGNYLILQIKNISILRDSQKIHQQSLEEVHESIDTTQKVKGWKKIFSFIGPAYLVSVGYMDPGNWATDIAGGSKYGYSLIWVLLVSNIMAILLQSLSARLGIVAQRDLAQANRVHFPKYINFILWIFAEIAIAATDLAEVLGMAIGIQLLFGLPLIMGVSITVLDTFLLLYLQKIGIRKIEAFIIALIGVIGICFLINIIIAQPSIHEILKGFFPSLPDAAELYHQKGLTSPIPKQTALYLAIGMIGATIMPHNLYLHSALIQTRKIKRTPEGIKEAIKWSIIDSSIALNIAFLINAAILILAATAFFNTGRTEIGEIKQAYTFLSPVLGSSIASFLFAIALIASGQSSTITGTLSGQIVMEGYLSLRINPVMRRLITRLIAIIPAVIFIYISGENNIDDLLIFSQVILSLQLGFAVIPLIHFVSNKSLMKDFAIKKKTQIFAWLTATIIIFLNIKMITDALIPFWKNDANTIDKLAIIISILLFISLLLFILIYPILSTKVQIGTNLIHPNQNNESLTTPTYQKIAIALGFDQDDHKILSSALIHNNKQTEFIIIHIVESAASILHGKDTADLETEKDREQLEIIVSQLNEKGIKSKGILGFNNRSKEIARIVENEHADLLIIGAHGHKGIKDFIYGSTVNKVRHLLKIPVFIVKI